MNEFVYPSVWLVRESVNVSTDPQGEENLREQDLFVLATSFAEAVEIVGTGFGRKIIAVQRVCPITQLPDDRYRVIRYPEEKHV